MVMTYVTYNVGLLLFAIFVILISETACGSSPPNGSMQNNEDVNTDAFLPLGSFYGFIHGFVASVSVIVVSELGDKTFFIAAIMAMKYSRLIVFVGALSALGFMTVLSAALGFATTVIPRKLTYYVSCALFVYFGLKMLYEGYKMHPNEGQEEYEEVQAELKKREEETFTLVSPKYKQVALNALQRSSNVGKLRCFELTAATIVKIVCHPRSGVWHHCDQNTESLLQFCLARFRAVFYTHFLAEWGDRSQLATIILASRENVLGVTLGGTIGHALCTGLAVIGGRLVAQRISVKTVTIVGGVVFLLFAISSLLLGP